MEINSRFFFSVSLLEAERLLAGGAASAASSSSSSISMLSDSSASSIILFSRPLRGAFQPLFDLRQFHPPRDQCAYGVLVPLLFRLLQFPVMMLFHLDNPVLFERANQIPERARGVHHPVEAPVHQRTRYCLPHIRGASFQPGGCLEPFGLQRHSAQPRQARI